MTGRATIAFIAAAAVVAAPAKASPWNREDGDVFLASRFDYFWSTTPISRYERYGSDAYAEFGVTPQWMLSGKLAYGTSVSESALGEAVRTGVGEAELSVQRQIHRGAHSATALSVVGAWTERLSGGERAAFGQREADVEIRVLHGRDVILQPIRIFAVGEAAYRRRFDSAADQFRADTLVGIEPTGRLLLLLEARSQISLRNEAPLGDDYDLIKARSSLVWRATPRLAVVAGGEKEFAARGIAPGVAIHVGLWSEF
ncbi:MAG: hypothetical protein ACOZAA_08750 [Pseudomonadota bacterium]